MKKQKKKQQHKKKQQESIFMPNEIFEDLQKHISKPTHIAFAYSYIYLLNYLYKFSKYIGEDNKLMNKTRIKEQLKVSPNNETYNYLIKKNGLLDKLHYTRITTDVPILTIYDDLQKELTFHYYSDLEPEDKRRFQKDVCVKSEIPIPIRAFFRCKEAENDFYYNGTFYDVENTHQIDKKIFDKVINKLTFKEFYLYGFLKYKTDKFKNYDASFKRLEEETMMSKTSLKKHLKNLEEEKIIQIVHQPFVLGLPLEKRRTNSYKTLM